MRLRALFSTITIKHHHKQDEQTSTVHRALSKLHGSAKPRYECQYCYEQKLAKELVAASVLPWSCQAHLTGPNKVCKRCLEAALSAQLDCKTLLDVGCPQCGTAWEPADIRVLVSSADKKRLRELDSGARSEVYVPQPDELPDQSTMNDMLKRGARLCPFCRYPFVKLGGCESMLCEYDLVRGELR